MIDQPFRDFLKDRVEPFLALYRRYGLSPNAVTLLGLGFGLLSALTLGLGWNWIALWLWWVGRALDGTDGIYARSIGKATDFGGYLDIVADMAAYSAMILGFAASRPQFIWWWLVILLLYVLCITSALALGSLERREGIGAEDNRSLKLAAGLAEGGETGIAYTLLLVLPGATAWLCPLWSLILGVTVLARTLVAKAELRR